jgi:hypothetical protein
MVARRTRPKARLRAVMLLMCSPTNQCLCWSRYSQTMAASWLLMLGRKVKLCG